MTLDNTHDNSPDPRDHLHNQDEGEVAFEPVRPRPSNPLPEFVVTENNKWDALAVIAAAGDIPLDVLIQWIEHHGWPDDEAFLKIARRLRESQRYVQCAIGNFELRPKKYWSPALRMSYDALIRWARDYLDEQMRKRAEEERERAALRERYGEHGDQYHWNPNLFTHEENETIFRTLQTLKQRRGVVMFMDRDTWDVLARAILTEPISVDDHNDDRLEQWADAIRDNRMFENTWWIDQQRTAAGRGSTHANSSISLEEQDRAPSELKQWARQLMGRHPQVTAVYWLDTQRAHAFPYDPTRMVIVLVMEAITSPVQWQQGFDALAADTTLERPLLDWYVLQWGAGAHSAHPRNNPYIYASYIAFASPTRGVRSYERAYMREGHDFVRVWPPRSLAASAGEVWEATEPGEIVE